MIKKNILITGCAGFIGFHTSEYFFKKKIKVIGCDNLNNFYDVNLKKDRLKLLKIHKKNFKFYKIDLQNIKNLEKVIYKNKIKTVIHLAAQAGVRDSIDYPKKYFDNNVIVFFNILEICRKFNVDLLYASSSSVYGEKKPMVENNRTKPIQFYAATKKTNETMASVYSKLYNFKSIGLRFFTVYGPYGRPDMSYYKFSKKIFQNKKIEIYNKFNHSRDFTYISDVTNLIFKCYLKIQKSKNIENQIYNVGSGKKISLNYLVKLLEKNFKKKFKIKLLNKQTGDIENTLANIQKAKEKLNYNPIIGFPIGIKKFTDWFNFYHKKL